MFKSIEDSNVVTVDPEVTVLVGQNESGKTAFLQALHKARSVVRGPEYKVVEDYPRRTLLEYQQRHETDPDIVATLTYELEVRDCNRINEAMGCEIIPEDFEITVTHRYNNRISLDFEIPEEPYIRHIMNDGPWSSDTRSRLQDISTVRDLIGYLQQMDLNESESTYREKIKETFKSAKWANLLEHLIWLNHLRDAIAKFLYFDDYYLLPGKVNLSQLQNRVSSNSVTEEDATVLGLLRMAGVELKSLLETTSYEEIKAKLEGISNAITDKIFEYWTQNKEIDVEFDIRTDTLDQPPFNEGVNLYIRIRNRRHRVTVPFSQRSKGFIWFFSFLVWFDSIRSQVGSDSDLILLLDEPGLSLHATAQADLLRYIDHLSEQYQIIYTTHSPFMIQSDRLHQVRTVEDKIGVGTKVSDEVSTSDQRTLFPLQAALGYTIAQNLFISKHNLLVEGPADLVYIQFFSNTLDQLGREGLWEGATIVPVGGLSLLSTFIALLRGNKLNIVVLHDYENQPDQGLETLVREKIVSQRQVLNYAMFRASGQRPTTTRNSETLPLMNTDVEDLMSPQMYLRIFNDAYAKHLNGVTIVEADLSPGDRIVHRINRYLESNGIQVRPSGGFNHYLVANYLASNPIASDQIDADTLSRFEQLFRHVNHLLSS